MMPALHELAARNKGKGGQLCLSLSGDFMGRLSNTVSMINQGVLLAVYADKVLPGGITYKFPQSYTAWMKRESLDEIFGREPVCEGKAEVFTSRCPPKPDATPAHPNLQGALDLENRCHTGSMLVDTSSALADTTTLCGCSTVVLIPNANLKWDHRYEETQAALSSRYWQGQSKFMEVPRLQNEAQETPSMVPGAFPKEVVMHVRLGDIETGCSAKFTEYNCNKKLQVESYVRTLQALTSVLPGRCMHLNIVTDGTRTSPDVLSILEKLPEAGIDKARVLTAGEVSAAKSFHFLTHADVLVFGSSGFGQFAAVMARNETARLGNVMPYPHPVDPLFFKANTTQLRAQRVEARREDGSTTYHDAPLNLAESRARVWKNEAIRAFAADCQRRLGQ